LEALCAEQLSYGHSDGKVEGSVASLPLRRCVVWSLPPPHAAQEERAAGAPLHKGPGPSSHKAEGRALVCVASPLRTRHGAALRLARGRPGGALHQPPRGGPGRPPAGGSLPAVPAPSVGPLADGRHLSQRARRAARWVPCCRHLRGPPCRAADGAPRPSGRVPRPAAGHPLARGPRNAHECRARRPGHGPHKRQRRARDVQRHASGHRREDGGSPSPASRQTAPAPAARLPSVRRGPGAPRWRGTQAQAHATTEGRGGRRGRPPGGRMRRLPGRVGLTPTAAPTSS